jgi:aldose 1-epimerase
MTIQHQPFGALPDGTAVTLYILANDAGCSARIATYGGTVVSLEAPDRHGVVDDVVLGYDTLADYLADSSYFGSLIGRCGNRIAGGAFSLNGRRIQLAVNNGPNHLHGGNRGFDKVVWDAEAAETPEGPTLTLRYLSPDGEENYPGVLVVTAVYTWTHRNALRLDFTATTDQLTICNLTNHTYFNLAGAGRGTILDHEIRIDADRFTPVDETLIPTGELAPVAGTPLDFTSARRIGDGIDADHPQIRCGGGYDHNFVLNKPDAGLRPAATVRDPQSGRTLQMHTTAPGTQFYSGNFLTGGIPGKYGREYPYRSGFCLEPQHFPDSPNHQTFPQVLLRPGETYRHSLVYALGTDG